MDHPYFFLSYARSDDRTAYVRRFYEDLLGVLDLPGTGSRRQPAFRDSESLYLGADWLRELSRAIGSCKTLVALYSPAYFRSQYCGKEWSAFAGRLARYREETDVWPPALVPVIWEPVPERLLPQEVQAIQYAEPRTGPTYLEHGLLHLMRSDPKSAEYRDVVRSIAERVQFAADRFNLASMPDSFDLSAIKGCFPVELAADDGFERSYLAALAARHSRVHIFGADVGQAAGMPLSAVYTGLTAIGGGENGARVPAEQLFEADRRRVLLRGAPGSGKTTLLQWLAVHAHGTYVPFPLPVRTLVRDGGRLPVPAQFLDAVGSVAGAESPPGWAERVLAAGRGLLLVDGLDEVDQAARDGVRLWLADLLAAYPDTLCVVTCRPSAIEDAWLADMDFTEFALAPLTLDDARLLISRWHDATSEGARRAPLEPLLDAVTNKAQLRSLVTSPLLCTLICALHDQRGGLLPSDRAQLYEAALSMLLERRDREREILHPDGLELDRESHQVLLQSLAIWLQRNGRSELDRRQAVGQVQRTLPALARLGAQGDAEQVLRHLLNRSGVLRESAPGRIGFLHRSFQDHLAAREAVDTGVLPELVARAHDDQWHNVVRLALGHATRRDRSSMFQAILNRGDQEPENRGRLFVLAAVSLADMVELEPAVRGAVEERIGQLIPPRTEDEAAALAEVGPMVLELLPGPEDLDADHAALPRLIRTAELIGGNEAQVYISRLASLMPSSVPDDGQIGHLSSRPFAASVLVDSWSVEKDAPAPTVRTLELTGTQERGEIARLGSSVQRVVCRGDFTDFSALRLLPLVHTLVISGNPALSHLGSLTGLPRLRTLSVSDCPLADLTALAGSGVMFLEISPVPETSVLAGLASAPRLRLLCLPSAGGRFDRAGWRGRLPGVTVLTGVRISR
ncbi:TIR-like protein FxsC [Streptomyces sp. NPDC002187]|uniref:TIR-like protein FxsC n=1 Tax=Streptomyces sp. NPDC002187 TaxID=3364637 RepID=UPI003698D9BE